MDIYDKVRIVVAKLDEEDYPLVLGAVPETTWEVIGQEDWDAAKREMGEKWLGPDASAYEYREAVVTIPSSQLALLFVTPKITVGEVSLASSEDQA